MKKSSNSRILVWMFSIGLLVASPNSVSAQGKASEKNLFPEGTEAIVGKASLPDPLTPYDSLIDTKLSEKSPIKETKGCANLEVWQPVAGSSDQWVSLIGYVPTGTSEAGVLALRDSTNCIKPGHPMRLVEIRDTSGIGTELGWFFPTAIHPRRSSSRELTDIENQTMLVAKLPLDSNDVVFVSGRVISSLARLWAPRMAGVRFIGRQQVESAIKDGTTIIDIRSRASFEKFRIKGSVNIPYTAGARG